MADRNRRNRNQSWRDEDNYGSGQAEQFQDTSYEQDSDYQVSSRRNDDQMGDRGRGGTNYYYEETVIIPRGNRQRSQGRDRKRGFDNDYDNDYGRQGNRGGGQSYRGSEYRDDDYSRGSRYGSRDRGYQSFSTEDQGGRDFSRDDRGHYGSGYGGGYAGGGYNDYGSRGRYGRDERGFFDKAGDEIASWFGDDDAARRREMDHRGRGPSNYSRTDERVLEDVCDELTEDWGVDARNIQVTVDKGEVTLDGTVDSRRSKRRAEDVAHDISGVNHVQNNLRVKDLDNNGSYGNETTVES